MKNLKILFIILGIFVLCGCSKSNVKEINFNEFNSLIKDNKTFILYVGSDTCISCKEFSPKFESVINDNNINNVYYIDLDDLSDNDKNSFNKLINVNGTPTVVFINKGEEESTYNRINGNVSTEKIITRLKANDYIK